MSFTQRLRQYGVPIAQVARRAGTGRFGWDGVIVGLPLDPAMGADEYRLILAGGRKRRAATPDAFTRLGAPIFLLSDYERRERNRLLQRLALPGGFEAAMHHNVGCDGGRNNLLQLAADAASTQYTGVQYCAVGNGASPSPAETDTTLANEYFRKAISIASVSSNEALLNTIFQTTEANTTYTEAGLFGADPTHVVSGSADTGIMFAHSTFAYTKTSAVELAINYFVSLT